MTAKYGLKAETIIAIQQVLAEFAQVQQAIIYGSRAKGNYKPGSDIDLTLVAAPKGQLNLSTQYQIEEALEELMLPYQFDLSILETIESKNLLGHIERVGQVFYERTR
ncbi:nucleotidyltransferase domain-containing protein [Endozoicomonas ascidiicola]|uniref:nucleotidyltransferase domain-containing protein n=1 Tax=Endozoicomonas ascidiicola TaxID=1698521 RepID=UPI00082A8877|nr:nucleotidyltransferase domain-containing protein [Endozoicomonas ascidiicola]